LVTGLVILLASVLAQAEQDAVATLNGEPIAREQVEARAALKLYRLRWEIYDTLKTEADALVDERLLVEEAEKRHMSVDDLLRAEVDDKVQLPTDEQVDEYIKQGKIATEPSAELKGRVKLYLSERTKIQRKLDYLQELRTKADYQFLLKPPEQPRAQVSVDDDPLRGNPEAPITIIHFASFSCEHCAESAQKIQRLTEEFPGLARWVHRDFINMFDERGLRAAEAGETAHAAGKFWEFHDRIYSLGGDFELEDLGKILEEIGVSAADYVSAHDDARYILEIKHDIEDGVQAGVTSVPVIFINGQYVSGTFPYEMLRKTMEEEARHLKQSAEQADGQAP